MAAIRIDLAELMKLHARLEAEVADPLEHARQRIRRTREFVTRDRIRYGTLELEAEFQARIDGAVLLFAAPQARIAEAGVRLRTAVDCFDAVDRASSEGWIHGGERYADLLTDPRNRLLFTREATDSALADFYRYSGLLQLDCAVAGGFWLLQSNGAAQLSDPGLRFIGRKEGFIDHLYDCPADCCTIGYGHKVHNGPTDGRASEAPYRDGITKMKALELLRSDAAGAEASVRKLVTVPLTQGQFDALVSFVFNLGERCLADPRILVPLNNGEFDTMAETMRDFCHAKNRDGEWVELPGLVDRRNEEAEMFLEEKYPDDLK